MNKLRNGVFVMNPMQAPNTGTALLAELRGILKEYADEDNWQESTVPVQGRYISNNHTEDHYTECFADGHV